MNLQVLKRSFFWSVFLKKNNWKLLLIITRRNRHGFFPAFVGFHGMGSRLTLAILAWIGADHAAHSQLQSPGLVRVKAYRRHPLEVKTKGAKQKDLGCRAAAFFAVLETCIFRRYKRSFGVHLPQKMKLRMCAKSGPNWCWFRWDMIETSFTLFSLRILIKRLLNHENNMSFIEANLIELSLQSVPPQSFRSPIRSYFSMQKPWIYEKNTVFI